MKLKLIAAALAFAAAGSANASIGNSTTGNGELFVTVVANGYSFVGDLGVAMDSFDTVRSAGELATSIDMNGFGQWSAFKTAIGGDLTGAKFAVMAVDSIGSGAGGKRLMTTYDQNLDLKYVNGTSGTSNSNFIAAVVNADVWAGYLADATKNIGTDMVPGTVAQNGSAYSDSALTSTYFLGTGIAATNMATLKAKLTFSTLADVGEHALFGTVSVSSTNNLAKVALAGYSTADGNYWTLQGDGLTYVAAPVPEADTYALLLAGMGMVGFLARRRKAA